MVTQAKRLHVRPREVTRLYLQSSTLYPLLSTLYLSHSRSLSLSLTHSFTLALWNAYEDTS